MLEVYTRQAGREPRDLRFYEARAGLRVAAIRARMIERDYRLGVCEDRSARERNPITQSLRRAMETCP